MADKYIQRNSLGELVEVRSVENSTGAADAGKLVALDDTGKLKDSLLPAQSGSTLIKAVASEAVTAGSLLNLWNNGGILSVRLANASIGRKAVGFTTQTKSSGQTVDVIMGGIMEGLSNITPSANYFLSATVPGSFGTTPPSSVGHISQTIGVGADVTSLMFNPQDPIKIA